MTAPAVAATTVEENVEENEMKQIATTVEPTGIPLHRALLLGGVVGLGAVWALATIVALGHGADADEALALGAFVGFWGGAGLGSMLAATIPLSRYLPAAVEAPASPTRRPD
jgi:hypothetical protein